MVFYITHVSQAGFVSTMARHLDARLGRKSILNTTCDN